MLADTWHLLSLHIHSLGTSGSALLCIYIYMNGYKYIMETYELDHIYIIF